MSNLAIISETFQERPHLHDFKKNDFVSPHPTMVMLTHDPFPDAGSQDVVHTVVVGTEFIWRAKIQSEATTDLGTGMSIERNGHIFAINKSTYCSVESVYDIEASALLSLCEPIIFLTQLRSIMAASSSVS